jgi:hypothetical protein
MTSEAADLYIKMDGRESGWIESILLVPDNDGDVDRSHWIHRVIPWDKNKVLEIPNWCPLRHGKEY